MKRILAIIITLSISISGIMLPCTAQGASLSDIEGTKYEAAASLLYDIGIIAGYDDGTFKPEKSVSRGELCALVARMLGLEGVSGGDSGRFNDIANSPYKDYIELLAARDVVDGIGDGSFSPDSPVLTEQVIKIVVGAMDYDVYAAGTNYPDNYINAASQNGFMKNTSSMVGEPMVRGEIAILLENVLEADAIEKTYGVNGSVYKKDTTIMHELLDIDKEYGTFTADENASILGEKTPGQGIVTITTSKESITANKGVLNTSSDLGKKGYFYIRNKGEDDAEILHFREAANGNKTMEIDAENLDEAVISDNGSKIQLYYYVGTSRKNVKLAENSRVLYNGKQVDTQNITEELFKLDDGKVTLISVSDGGYDTVLITSYMSFVVNSVRSSTYEVFVKPSNNKINGAEVSSLVLDKDDPSTDFTLTLDGQEIDIEDLKEFDVISVMSSMDKEMMEITVSRETVTGQATTVGDDDSKGKFCAIDGETYYITSGMKDSVNVGDTGTFYLDSFGKIAYYDVELNAGNLYGYVLKSYQEDGGEDYTLRVLTHTGEVKNMPLKSNVNYNGSQRSARSVASAIGNTGAIIRYSVNSDGVISKLYTAVDNGSADYQGYDKNNFSKDNNSADGSMYFKSTVIPGFNGRYLIDDKTVIFTIPTDVTDYDNYRVANSGYFVNDIYYNVDIYDTDRSMVAGAIVSKGIDATKSDEQSLSWNEPVLLVDTVQQEVDDNDEIVYMVRGLKNGQEVAVSIADENADGEPVMSELYGDWQNAAPDKLTRGSVIQYKTNIDGELDDFRILNMPNASMRITNLDPNSGHKIECQTVLGIADVCRDGILKITLNEGASYNEATGKVFAVGNANIYLYDSKKKEIRNAGVEDILSRENSGDSASKVFIRAYKETVGDIVIYE